LEIRLIYVNKYNHVLFHHVPNSLLELQSKKDPESQNGRSKMSFKKMGLLSSLVP
jgi:hypothetical protein